MIEIARKLSKDFQFVRVDLYCKDPDSSSIEGNVFFGELTFAPRAGKTPGEGQKEAGKLLPDFGGEEYLADRLVAIEQKYGGICEGVKRRKVSPTITGRRKKLNEEEWLGEIGWQIRIMHIRVLTRNT